MNTKKLIAMLLAILMLAGVLSGCGGSSKPAEAPAQTDGAPTSNGEPAPAATASTAFEKDRYLVCTATPATSALYSYYVGLTKALSTKWPTLHFTVSEVTGAVDSTKRIRTGDADMGNTMDNCVYESFTGTGSFEGDSNPDTRIMWYYNNTPVQIVVTKESGVKTLSDLSGKKFNPGATGTGVATLMNGIIELFGLDVDLYAASQADAADAVTSRQIIGTAKTGSVGDSYITQIAASIDIDIISMSQEEIDAICEKYPYLGVTTIPAGVYKGVDHEVHTVFSACAVMSMKDMFTQEEVYLMWKALQGEDEIKAVWTAACSQDIANTDMEQLTLDCAVTPLHPGTVQYLVEMGYTVPEEIIPPEYVPVN